MSGLAMWTVYKHPKDFPDDYVARLFQVDAQGPKATHVILVSPDLDSLRDKMEGLGLVKLMRNEEDDPVIVETWL